MFWLYLLYVACLAVLFVAYFLSTARERQVFERVSRINRLQIPLNLLLVEIKLVAETTREGKELEIVELVQMTKSIDRIARRLEYTRQTLDL